MNDKTLAETQTWVNVTCPRCQLTNVVRVNDKALCRGCGETLKAPGGEKQGRK
jgi:ribosomal protein S27E